MEAPREGALVEALNALSSADRGFVTWLATMVREPVESVWTRLLGDAPAADGAGAHGTRFEGRHIVRLDLTAIGPQLRWVVGDGRRLSLPVAGLDHVVELDCSGLDLDALDVRLMPQLRVLRCADNRLRELDVSPCTGLEVLDCARNALMVLDLRANAALRELQCGDNGLGVLVLPEPRADGPLTELSATRNNLMVLDVGARPNLRALRCDRNALVRFDIGEAPRLEQLDLSNNELTRLALPPLPALRSLAVARNQLDACGLSEAPALEALVCHGNYVAALDLRPHPELATVDAHGNQLLRVDLGQAERLVELDLSDNRLEQLDVSGCARLQALDLGNNSLSSLALAGCPALRALDVVNNPLTALDVAPASELLSLRCDRTRLAELDIRGNPALAELRTVDARGGGPTVNATLEQCRSLRELREGRGLGTGATDPARLDLYELHDLARTIGARDADHRMMAIVTAPACDLGTALMVYWTNTPHYYLRYAARDDVPAYEQVGWDLLAAIEARVASGGYATASIPFDPSDDRLSRGVRGVDWTRDPTDGAVTKVRQVADALRKPVSRAAT